MAFLPNPLRTITTPARALSLFATTGFLPEQFRSMMALAWSPTQQRRFEWLLAALRLADHLIPRQAWLTGYRLYLWDMRIRKRLGMKIV